jgi:hypothetical protein
VTSSESVTKPNTQHPPQYSTATMPALVAKADTCAHHCSLASNPHKSYNTQSNPSDVQPKPVYREPTHSKPNSKKLAAANSLLASKSSKGSSVKTPPGVEGEVQESKPIQLVSAAVAPTDLSSDIAPNESLCLSSSKFTRKAHSHHILIRLKM